MIKYPYVKDGAVIGVTAKWRIVLSTKPGNSVLQQSSDKYQKKWQQIIDS